MSVTDCLLTAAVAVVCGIDRTAAFQMMLSRPIVAGPLAGLVLGQPLVGLQVGLLVELLWLGRLPVGASIPPDDTQLAVGTTFLAISIQPTAELQSVAILFAVVISMPLAKCGQIFDRFARRANDTVSRRAGRQVQSGDLNAVRRLHMVGLGHFALAALSTFLVIVVVGSVLRLLLFPTVLGLLKAPSGWMQLLFPLVGAAMLLASINVSRVMSLFGASFLSAALMLWLL